MTTTHAERLQLNSEKVLGFMDTHGDYLDSMKGVTGTVARLLHSVFKDDLSKENESNNKWSISAMLTKVLDVVSPQKGGLLGFWNKDKGAERDAFELPALQAFAPSVPSSGDLLKSLNITSNDIGTANILNDLNITSNSIDDVTAGEILKALNISSNPIVGGIADSFAAQTGTPRFSPEDEVNRRVQRTSMQSGMDAPLNL